MTKVYGGYLYQIGPNQKKGHDYFNLDSGITKIAPDGYVMYKKIPFRNNVVREIITGKEIPVIASGTSQIFGAHTFIKYDGTMYQGAKPLSSELVSNYLNKHLDSEDYAKELDEIFATGENNARKFLPLYAIDTIKNHMQEKKRLSNLVKEAENNTYKERIEKERIEKEEIELEEEQTNLDNVAPVTPTAVQNNVTSVTPNAVQNNVTTVANNNVAPVSSIATQNSMIHANVEKNNLLNVKTNGLEKAANPVKPATIFDPYANLNAVHQNPVDPKTIVDPNPDSVEVIPTPSIYEGEKKEIGGVSGKETVPDVAWDDEDLKVDFIPSAIQNNVESVMPKEETNIYEQKVSTSYAKSETVVSTFGRENNDVIKELAEIAAKGGEAVATIEGVEVSTKYLVNEEDLIEYFLAKRYDRVPNSLNVKTVIANERSMNEINKDRSL